MAGLPQKQIPDYNLEKKGNGVSLSLSWLYEILTVVSCLPLKPSEVDFLALSIDSGVAFTVTYLSGITTD